MIIKSMSRKVPSFGQLLGYIDRDEGNEQYTLRHNVMGRDGEHIQSEFEANGELLQKRKNGVYLYHEIISITRAQGLSPDEQKDRLMDIALNYVEARCPDNLVYGGLHEDKEHSYHMHLMISANRAGETGRLRLTKSQFREVQVQLERHVLQKYPELEQKLAIDKKSDRGRSKNEAELERRTGKRPKREEVLERITSAYEQSEDRQSLLDALGREGLELYVRGKNLGVIDHESGKRHRLKTLDFETADRIAIRMEGGEAALDETTRKPREPEQAGERETPQEKPASEGEKEKTRDRERAERRKNQEQAAAKEAKRQKSEEQARKRQRDEKESPEADNPGYVKRGSNADLNRDVSKQKERTRQQAESEKEEEMKRGQHNGDPEKPNLERQELIDKGHVKPDPERDLMSHEDWREHDTFLGKMKQSVRRTFDDFRGRTKDLEEKAQGKEQARPSKKRDEPQKQPDRSAQQEKWRSEISRRRDSGRDDPDRGRE